MISFYLCHVDFAQLTSKYRNSGLRMAGIYIHIPFCRQACHYCNFHFSTSTKLKNGFLGALLNEIVLQNNFLEGEIVETVYFGGGTPSLLSANELALILNA